MEPDEKTSLIKMLGFITLWITYGVNAYTFLNLAISNKIDLLLPFKSFIVVGLVFAALFSLINIVFRGDDPNLLVLVIEGVLFAVSLVGTYLTITSLLSLGAEFQLTFDISVCSGCIIGVFLGLIGLLAVTYIIFFRDR
jgi:hypothetical protein